MFHVHLISKMAISRQQLPKTTEKKRGKISKVMREFKNKKLNIGQSKKKVKNRKQAIAIALSEAMACSLELLEIHLELLLLESQLALLV